MSVTTVDPATFLRRTAEPIATLPGDFVGPPYAEHPARYTYEFDGDTRAELGRILDRIERGDAPGGGHHDAALAPAVRDAIAVATTRTIAALDTGPGFLLLRGVPVEGRSPATLGALYTMMGGALGRPLPQNLDGELLTDIRDTGADPADPEVRLYRTRAEQDFHTDGADVIGLLCVQPAARGGASRIVSSVRVVQVVGARRPDLAPLLFEPWPFRIPGARARGLPEIMTRPICRFDGHKLETFFIGWYLRDALTVPSVPPLDDARRELLAVFEATANDPALYLDMDFRPGDVQWLRNAFVLHKRTAYEDHAEPARKRHLLRLWLGLDRLADGTPRFAAVTTSTSPAMGATP
jgi:hypothetical protein